MTGMRVAKDQTTREFVQVRRDSDSGVRFVR